MPSKTRKTKDPLTFDEYKTIKDEIIEISEQRFENILTKRLKEFKVSLMEEINMRIDALENKFSTKFDAIDSRFDAIDSRFDAIDSRFEAIDSRFEAIDSKFDGMNSKFGSLEKRMTFLTWFLPVFMTMLMLTLKYFGK